MLTRREEKNNICSVYVPLPNISRDVVDISEPTTTTLKIFINVQGWQDYICTIYPYRNLIKLCEYHSKLWLTDCQTLAKWKQIFRI